jgi:exoribonuclease R
MTQLEEIFKVSQVDSPPTLHGILQTKNYHDFMIMSDIGDVIHTFTGSKIANTCLPGDHVSFTDRCELELRYDHPLIVGTLELANKSTYGLTKRGYPMYLFTPYNASYPHFIVGCSEKDTSTNRIVVIKFDSWRKSGLSYPRGLLERNIGVSGEYHAEYKALIWQACPYHYPEYAYELKRKETSRQMVEGYTFNIDPEGCKDIDDVITFKKLEKGWLVTITISDVATYVEDGSAIDIMASLIGQTLYDQGMIIKPMLPHAYQNECSLAPLKTSYGISMQFEWNTQISNITWFESILTNNRTFTYEEFQRNPTYPLQELASYLGGTQLDDSHKWVEQMMLFYNKEAGKMLKAAKMGILRRHSAPDQERLERYSKFLPEFEYFAFSSAEYCLAEESSQHYGLNTDAYAHATSPIRRYADLVNQRVLKLLIQRSLSVGSNGSLEDYYVPVTMYDMKQREKAIKHFARDVDFLKAITSGTSFTGIIMDTIPKEDRIKVKIYVHEWKRIVSVYYKIVDGQILSRDQKTELDISLYRSVKIECAVIPNARNWKERIIIHIQ